jgi:hypothetical protein
MTMMVKNTLNNANDDIKVQFPQGAGGVFLSSVLACCTQDIKWEKNQRINFHAFPAQVAYSHTFKKSSNVICIDSPLARYNFWVNYFRKKILCEVPYYRYQGKKWIKSPFENLDAKKDGFWLLNQARFIDHYVCQQSWQIDWIEMLEHPAKAWETIDQFLESNQKNNFWTLSQWLEAVDNYCNTLPKKITINPHHVHWQIWAIGILQNQDIISEIDIIENFRNQAYTQWLYKYIENALDYTIKRTYYIG